MSRSTRYLLSAFVALAALAPHAFAQGGRDTRTIGQPAGQIQGQVRLPGGQPAFNVVVSCDSFQGGLVAQERTDRNGRFLFRGLGPAQFVVTVRESGYREEQQTVELQTTASAYLQFTLKADPSSSPGVGGAGSTVSAASDVPAAAQKEFDEGRALVMGNDTKKLGEGLRHLEKAVAIYPKYLDAHVLLGTSYMDAKQWEKAEAELRRAIEINPKATTAYFALGEVLRRGKKYDEAERVLTEGLKLDDKSARGHFALGEVYWEKNDLPKAGVQVGTALQLKPDFAEAHLLAGNILLRARKGEEALAEFQEYLRLAPDGEFAPRAREISQKLKEALGKK